MNKLQQLARLCDTLSEWTGRLVAWLTLGMVLTTFVIVILRYAFNMGWIAMQESVTYMHTMVFMLGAAYTLKHDGHVRVDIFYAKFGPRGKAVVDLAGTLLLLVPVCAFILYSSWGYVAESWSLHEGSMETGGLPWVYWLKTTLVALPVLMLIQGLSLALHSLLTLTGHRQGAPEHDANREL